VLVDHLVKVPRALLFRRPNQIWIAGGLAHERLVSLFLLPARAVPVSQRLLDRDHRDHPNVMVVPKGAEISKMLKEGGMSLINNLLQGGVYAHCASSNLHRAVVMLHTGRACETGVNGFARVELDLRRSQLSVEARADVHHFFSSCGHPHVPRIVSWEVMHDDLVVRQTPL